MTTLRVPKTMCGQPRHLLREIGAAAGGKVDVRAIDRCLAGKPVLPMTAAAVEAACSKMGLSHLLQAERGKR